MLSNAFSKTREKISKKVVIYGGGITGASVAYNLGLLGLSSETLFLNTRKWYEPATRIVGVFRSTASQVRLAKQTVATYNDLLSRNILQTEWNQCGSLNIAKTIERMTVFRRMAAQSVLWDIECELLNPKQCKDKCSVLNTDDIIGGLWIPSDGVASNVDSVLQRSSNVECLEDRTIEKVLQNNGHVTGVQTNNEVINCEYFVNCASYRARDVGKLSEPRVKVPVSPAEHYMLEIGVDGSTPKIPVVRDFDGQIYFCENGGEILAGGFPPILKPSIRCERTEEAYRNGDLVDWDDFHPLLEQILHRVPTLKDRFVRNFYNEPEDFSPDNKWIIGEAPEIRNYFIVAGMETAGYSAGLGAGQAIADLIVKGHTQFDISDLEPSRFLGLHNNKFFLRDRVKEASKIHYGITYPFVDAQTARKVRMSPIYPKLKEAGAVFGQVMGYERPNWFEGRDSRNLRRDKTSKKINHSFGKPHWFDYVSDEYAACRESIGISDYSSFTKFDLWSQGNEVVDALQYVCSNDVDVPLGAIIHTGMQNKYGGYENDCSLARITANHYMMIAPSIQQTRCKAWLQKHLPATVAVSDVTSTYTALCLLGPLTRKILSEMTETDLNPKTFPFFTFKMVDIGFANDIRAMNLTHTGELGYVLYIPNEYALHVYSRLIEAGRKHGIKNGVKHVGYYATRSLRLEKFFAFWGQDLDTRTTPLECGRVWRVKFDKKMDFIGKDALLKQRDEGVKRMYIQLILDNHSVETDLWPWGGEPIYRDGKLVGTCTTTGYGYTFQKQVCLGFVENRNSKGDRQIVTNDYVLNGDYEIDIAGSRYKAKVHIHSPVLPTKFPDQERDVYRATRDPSFDKLIVKSSI